MLCMVLVMMMGWQEALRNTNTIILTITFMLGMVLVMRNDILKLLKLNFDVWIMINDD